MTDRIRLPFLDALRTLLVTPTSGVREILDNQWANRHPGGQPGT